MASSSFFGSTVPKRERGSGLARRKGVFCLGTGYPIVPYVCLLDIP